MLRNSACIVGLLVTSAAPLSAQLAQPERAQPNNHASLDGSRTVTVVPGAGGAESDLLRSLLRDPELLKKLVAAQQPGSPRERQRQIDEIRLAHPELRDPQRLQNLAEEADRLLKGSDAAEPEPPKLTPLETFQKKVGDFARNLKEGPKAPPPEVPLPIPNRTRRAPLAGEGLKPNAKVVRWLRENLGDQPEFNELLKNLDTSAGSGDWQRSEWFAELKAEASEFGDWVGRQNFDLPSFKLAKGGFSSPNFNGPSFLGTAPTAPSAQGSGTVTGVLAALLAGLAAVWFRMRRSAGKPAGEAGSLTQPLPLAFDPQAIGTAGDLVAAYDKLGVRTLGAEARHWNHRTIGRAMNAHFPAGGEALAALTALYEKARYTRSAAPLDEGEIAAARRQLADLLERETR